MTSKGYNEKNMLKLTYTYNDLPMHKAAAESMQASLKEVYVDLQLKQEEKETFFNHRDAGEFEVCRHAMTADFLDPMAYLSMYYVNAGEKSSGADRMNKLHKAEEYLVKEKAYVIPLFGYTDPNLKATDLEGVTSSPEGHYNLTRAYYQ